MLSTRAFSTVYLRQAVFCPSASLPVLLRESRAARVTTRLTLSRRWDSSSPPAPASAASRNPAKMAPPTSALDFLDFVNASPTRRAPGLIMLLMLHVLTTVVCL
jgi:hypothetical protein